jgi:membrane-bound serine protease (ClpP class)
MNGTGGSRLGVKGRGFSAPTIALSIAFLIGAAPAGVAARHKKEAAPVPPAAPIAAAPPTRSALAGAPAESKEALIVTVTLDDAVHPITARFFKDALSKADKEEAALLILRLDTPGGLMTSMEEMITAITHARTPVVVFVHGSKAASAGFFLTIAADVAVMAPGTRIGAAHPVAAMGEIPKDSPMMAKVENDAAAYIRTLATNRGRNAAVAETAVRDSKAFTEQEALASGLIDFIASNETEIITKLGGRPIQRFSGERVTLDLSRTRTVSLDMSGRERFLSLLANPALAALLLFVGVLGLYVEFTHPGMIAPGLVGGVCLLLFMMSTQTLPVSWVGVGLVVLGLVMFVLEIKVASHGALTAGGIASLIVGSMLLFRGASDLPGFHAARLLIVGIAASAGVLMGILSLLIARVWRRKAVTGAAGLLSEEGTALTDLDPDGRVFVHGEYWNAHAGVPVRRGARVQVTGVRDLVLDVEELGSRRS